MAMEFLRVTFPETRDVLAGGDPVGVTNQTLMIPADSYEISLSGSGFAPASRTVVVSGTTPDRPLVVAFTPVVPVV